MLPFSRLITLPDYALFSFLFLTLWEYIRTCQLHDVAEQDIRSIIKMTLLQIDKYNMVYNELISSMY